jgi:hypothetical protein
VLAFRISYTDQISCISLSPTTPSRSIKSNGLDDDAYVKLEEAAEAAGSHVKLVL